MSNLKLSALALLMSSTVLLAGPVEDKLAELEAAGYTVTEVEDEGGLVEIEATGPDGELEILMDPETGEIIEEEFEDEDDDDDDADDDDADEDDDNENDDEDDAEDES
jgi:hypothetical protein